MDTKKYTCTECGEPCNASWEDFGIGSYEFWGQKCTQTDWQFVSDCCEAPVEEDPPEEDDRGDWERDQMIDRQFDQEDM